MARCVTIQLNYTTEERGTGTDEDPIRNMGQLWSLDGSVLVAEHDEFTNYQFADLEHDIGQHPLSLVERLVSEEKKPNR